jgi:hypothetical protein
VAHKVSHAGNLATQLQRYQMLHARRWHYLDYVAAKCPVHTLECDQEEFDRELQAIPLL